MRKVEVHHIDHASGRFVHVANVEVDGDIADASVQAALEVAYTRTQNIDGSWSRGPFVHDAPNQDYHPSITVLVPLPSYQGQMLGLRSSMMGDRLVLDGNTFEVATFGFMLVG